MSKELSPDCQQPEPSEFEEWFANEYPLPPTIERGIVGREFKDGCRKAWNACLKCQQPEPSELGIQRYSVSPTGVVYLDRDGDLCLWKIVKVIIDRQAKKNKKQADEIVRLYKMAEENAELRGTIDRQAEENKKFQFEIDRLNSTELVSHCRSLIKQKEQLQAERKRLKEALKVALLYADPPHPAARDRLKEAEKLIELPKETR